MSNMKIHFLIAITLWEVLIQTGSSETGYETNVDGTVSTDIQYVGLETEDGEALQVYGVLEENEIKVPIPEENIPTINENAIPENCYEGIEKTIPIMFQEEWNGGLDVIETVKPIEYVFVRDGGEFCFTTNDCVARVHSERRTEKSRCGIRENFYVGDDGNVYEGRGWHITPFWYLNGFRNKSLTVQFLGSYATRKPSSDVKYAFETTMEIGIWLGYLSKDYKIISMSRFLNDSSLLGEEMNRNLMKWYRWTNETTLYSHWQYIMPSRLRFVLRQQWKASHPQKEPQALLQPVEYIIISENGDKCFTRTECTARVKAEQTENNEQYGDLLDNFYIGDGGEVFEGRGWDVVPHWYIKGIRNKYMSVQLLGSFQHDLPSELAINSLKLLIQTGVWMGKIVPDYKIFSLRDIYMEQLLLGDSLYKYAIEWSPWYKTTFPMSVRNLESLGLLPLISRMNWRAEDPVKSYPYPRSPIEYVLVGDGGDSCSNLHECIMLMQQEQAKYRETYGDLLDNFYIGGDGNIYEGKGWTVIPHWNLKYFERSFISVKFIGSFQNRKPSPLAMLAFNSLMKIGILSNNISPNYKIYSLREIYNNSSLLGDEINTLFQNQERWANDLASMPESQRYSSGLIPILSREHWNATGFRVAKVTNPFEYVVIGDGGNRCFTLEECTSEIQSLGKAAVKSHGDVPDNFYIGEDGSAIEGLGWNSVSRWNVKGMNSTCLFIRFLGRFQDTLPSKFATLSLQRLIQYGADTGKLLWDYKILSIRQLFNVKNNTIGDMLSDDIKTWLRWSKHSPFNAVENSSEQDIFVPRNDWNAINTTLRDAPCSRRSSVIVLQAGKRCFTLQECISRLQTEQNRTISRLQDLPANFYVGDDGRVYEGRGWDNKFDYYGSSILVAFLGKFQHETPSAKAKFALNYLIVRGIISGKLEPSYTLHSIRQLCSNRGLLGDALHIYLSELENFSMKQIQCSCSSNCNSCPDYFTYYPLISLYEAVNQRSDPARRRVLTHPLEYVYVRQGNSRCYNYTTCRSIIKRLHEGRNTMTENFYIGDDGNAYEGQGWEWRSYWDFKSVDDISITIQFLGSFERESPSSNAMEAFENVIKTGLTSNKLSTDFEVYFLKDKAGSKLKETINAWVALNKVIEL